jgi:uncharacterized protein YecT (DUF1311 family)
MRRILPAVILMAIASGTLLAQDSGQLDRCLYKADTQLEMNSCANEEAVRAEAELKDLQQKLALAARKEPGAIAKIGAVARTWIAYRDAYLKAMYPAKDKQAAYGSIFRMEFGLLRAKVARRQIEALRELLKQYE